MCPSTRFDESRGDGVPARITGGSSGHFSRPADKAGGQAKQVKLTKVNSSSGWATLQQKFLIPYRLDSGADHCVISEDTVTALHKEAFLKLRNLPEPVEVEQGDGTI